MTKRLMANEEKLDGGYAYKCRYCGKEVVQVETIYRNKKMRSFCDKECLDQYCEEYLQENFRDYAYMMGVTIRD